MARRVGRRNTAHADRSQTPQAPRLRLRTPQAPDTPQEWPWIIVNTLPLAASVPEVIDRRPFDRSAWV